MAMVVVMLWHGLFDCALHVTAHIENLLALVDPTVLACGVGEKRNLARRAQANVLGLHRVVRTAASNAGS